MELVKSNKGRKATRKATYKKKQPQRGMGVAQLERLRIQERWKKMTESTATTTTTTTTTTTHFPSDHQPIFGTGKNVSLLHGVANCGLPMMINGGNGGLWGWGGETSGLMMQRVAGNGGFVGLNGQVLVGAPGSFQAAAAAGVGVGVVGASKELSSMPKLQHCKPDHCSTCIKKHCNGENVKFTGLNEQFSHVLANKGADFLGHRENNMNINETVEVLAIHRKGNSMVSGSVLMEYEFFPGKIFSAEASVAVDGEVSHANGSDCVDLSLKL